MFGLLDRPGDKPSRDEEDTIQRLRTAAGRKVLECRVAIARAQARQQAYLARGDMRSAEIEEQVKNRRLDELSANLNPAQRTAADKVVAEKYPSEAS